MTLPALPALGSTSWYAYATALDTQVRSGTSTVRYDQRTNGYNWKASNTHRLRASLGRAQAGTGVAHHAFIGDSETSYFVGTGADQLGMWPRVYQTVLASMGIPKGGTGVVVAADAGAGPMDPRWTYPVGTWTNNNEYRSTSASGAQALFTSDLAGTTADVWYFGTSGGFTVSIDGAAAVTVTPAGGLTVQRYTVTGLSNATHTVRVTTTSTSPVYLIAANVSGASGLIVHDIARYGSYASQNDAGSWTPTGGVSIYTSRAGCLPTTPDVVWIALGVNDYQVVGITDPTIATAAISGIAGRFPSSDVILVAQYQPATNSNWPDYVTALHDLADSLDVPLLDMYDRSGGTTVATANGLMGDTVHPNSAAQRDWGRAAAMLAA